MLAMMSKIYEIVVFTSSDRSYANSILDYIDQEKKWIHHRLYREDCTECAMNVYLKDLTALGRDLKNVIIVDNAPYAFALQLENGYPIVPFYECKGDKEIEKLTKYLLQIQFAEDVRTENRKKFRLRQLLDVDIRKFIQYYQPGSPGNSSNEPSIETLHSQGDDSSCSIGEKVKKSLKNYQLELDAFYAKKNGN